MTYQKLDRNKLAARVAADIPDGAIVNLGIGQPTLVGNHLPADREIVLHSENGLLGMGPAPAPGDEDEDLINAGKQPVTIRPGAAYFHHADSFAMMRGGHLDYCVLGGFQVSRNGDLANWHTGAPGAIPAVGGAMDLAIGARHVFVMMELLTREGQSKLVETCTYPLTGVGCVERLYTDLATFDITAAGVVARDLVDGLSFAELQRLTGIALIDGSTGNTAPESRMNAPAEGLVKSTAYRPYAVDTQPPYLVDAYGSTIKRAPSQPLVPLAQTLSEVTGPRFGHAALRPGDEDMTHYGGGEALGERIHVGGRLIDEDGRPIRDALIEIWQANSAGRYVHAGDQHDAPLDPHFLGMGATVTDGDGFYRFKTIKPAAYPWRNHHNAWRPAHIHFSLFGDAYAQRLVTQMYFPGDPLMPFDPIFNSTADPAARERLVAAFDWESTSPEYALGYRFDIVLRGRDQTPMEAS